MPPGARCKWIPSEQDGFFSANLYFEHVLEVQEAKANQENTKLKQNNITTIGKYYLW